MLAYKINVLSEIAFKYGDNCNRMLDVIVDDSLMVINKDV